MKTREFIQVFRLSIKKFAWFILFIIISNNCTGSPKTYAEKGVLDLRSWNWKANGITDLNGEWEFYWKNLYTPSSFDSAEIKPPIYSNVPGFWNSLVPGIGLFNPAFGYATYRLKILCPASNEKLELKFLTVASAYKLFVNRKQVLQVGKVGTSKATTTPDYIPVLIPVMPENNELDILIQVANYNYSTGGLWDFIKLGTHEQIHRFLIKSVAVNFFISGSFFLMSLFYFVIYFNFKRGKASLYFSMFCMLLAIRPLVIDEMAIKYFTNWNWQFIKHLEFIFFYLSVPILSLFSYELFPKEFSKKVLRCILIISLPFVLVAVFTSPFIFRYPLRFFQLFMLLTACYGLFVYITAVKNKRAGSIYFFIGIVVLFISIINDLLYTSLIIESIHLIYAGLFVFIISQAMTLSKQFFQLFTKVEIANKKLELVNVELNEKNNTINESNDQLVKLNSELDILVSRTSHDLRSPITSILAFVHLIKEEKDEAKRNHYLSLQTKTLYRLNSLISDILDFSKNKRTELNFEPVDLNEFTENILQDYILSDDSANIKRMVKVEQQGKFITDKARLNMILGNLISNALKYHNKEQDAPYLKIIISAFAHEAVIEVSDNGQGIDDKHLEHIFRMFYRANQTSAGSGLGLYIVKEAVEKLGGTIKIESQLKVGTRFIINIPNYAINA